MSEFNINTMAIIGVGLIGGSLARALKKHNTVQRVLGYGRRTSSLVKAKQLGVIDDFSTDISEVVKQSDMIVVATPLGSYESLFKSMATHIKPDAIITDVGSVKGNVVEIANSILDDASRFVPGHPIAGTEQSGVEASFAELFEKHRVILTPTASTNVHALGLVTAMWETTGADVTNMEVQRHDKILAATSHLPHMLAYALVDCLATMDESEEIFSNAAGGFADFTRIASSSPEMWHDICYANRNALLTVLDNFDEHINVIRNAIKQNDSQGLLAIFQNAKQQRDAFLDQRQRPLQDD